MKLLLSLVTKDDCTTGCWSLPCNAYSSEVDVRAYAESMNKDMILYIQNG